MSVRFAGGYFLMMNLTIIIFVFVTYGLKKNNYRNFILSLFNSDNLLSNLYVLPEDGHRSGPKHVVNVVSSAQ
jgi:hypothetical protein